MQRNRVVEIAPWSARPSPQSRRPEGFRAHPARSCGRPAPGRSRHRPPACKARARHASANMFFIGRKSLVKTFTCRCSFARLRLGQADRGDRRLAEHRAGDVIIGHRARHCRRTRYRQRHGPRGSPPGSVAPGRSRRPRHRCWGTMVVIVFIDRDLAVRAQRDPSTFQPQPIGLGTAPGRDHHRIGVNRLAARRYGPAGCHRPACSTRSIGLLKPNSMPARLHDRQQPVAQRPGHSRAGSCRCG